MRAPKWAIIKKIASSVAGALTSSTVTYLASTALDVAEVVTGKQIGKVRRIIVSTGAGLIGGVAAVAVEDYVESSLNELDPLVVGMDAVDTASAVAEKVVSE